MGGRAAPERTLTAAPPAVDVDRPTTALDPELAGLYGPDSEAWRLNREAALLLGAGPRALLLQIAHPLVAEGVDQHSDFRADPWARLAGTLRSYLRIVYGTGTAARSEIRRLNGLHRSIGGPVRDEAIAALFGASYEAREPALSLWVHATLVDATLATGDAWLGPTPADVRRRFYAETLPVARLFGVPEGLLPADVDAFDDYVASMLSPDGPVHPSPTARELARVILHPPLAPLVESGPIAAAARAAGPAVCRAPAGRSRPRRTTGCSSRAIGLLPPSTRDEYGLDVGAARARDRRLADRDVGLLARAGAAALAMVPPGAGRRPAGRQGAGPLALAARRPVGHRVGERADRRRRAIGGIQLEPEPLDPVPAVLLPADGPELADPLEPERQVEAGRRRVRLGDARDARWKPWMRRISSSAVIAIRPIPRPANARST